MPIFEMRMSGAPIAIIKMGDKQLSFVKINKFKGKYFATKWGGIYEVDDEYEYRYKNTSVYFYNFNNSKPLSLSGMHEIDQTLRTQGKAYLPNVKRIQEEMEFQKQLLPPDQQLNITMPEDITENMSATTQRFLESYSTDDEYSKTNIMVNIHHQKKAIERHSSNLIGIGLNRGAFAWVQIAHKKLEIVPMIVHHNRVYTKYGVFKYMIDNVYLYKRQLVCFYILSDSFDEPVYPYPRGIQKQMKQMIKAKRWNALDSFHTPFVNKKKEKNVNKEQEKKEVKKEPVVDIPSPEPKPVENENAKALLEGNVKKESTFKLRNPFAKKVADETSG